MNKERLVPTLIAALEAPSSTQTHRRGAGRAIAIALTALLGVTTAPLLAEGSAEKSDRQRYEREHHKGDKASARSHRGERQRDEHRYRDRNRDRHRDRHQARQRDRSHRDRRYDNHRRERHDRRHDRYRYERRRYDHRYDRHRSDHRYRTRHRSFSLPRQILRHLVHDYVDYFFARHYYADHGHYHTIYRFPYEYEGRVSYRPYAYCEGDLFARGRFNDGGFEFDHYYN